MCGSGERGGRLYGGIEAGGTKFVCAMGASPDDIGEPARFPTSAADPRETVAQVVEWFKEQAARRGPLTAVGVGSFGPVDLREGRITTTPKTAWRSFPLRQVLEEALGVPVALDTDVNAAAVGEQRWGAAHGLSDFLYLTVGTGIGGGAMVNGRLMHGAAHPEMGHILIPRHEIEREDFRGVCPWHLNCLEGLASGPSIERRWGKPATELEPEHPAWELEACYLATGLVTLICTLSPQCIVLGGGVMGQEHLFPRIRLKVEELLNGYVPAPPIVPPAQRWCGVLGAIALAQELEPALDRVG